MGSSARKKREKKKDFQKQKLKVGKAKPKAENHTDTSFRSQAIVLNQQLDVNAPSQSSIFLHQISLLASRSDTQRRDALASLTSYVTSSLPTSSLPISTSSLLSSVCPLMLDGSAGVRSQLLKLFGALPQEDIRDHVTKALPYLRAAMTHLSRDIRLSSLEFVSYMIKVAGSELISCPGGWHQTLECFTTVLGWRSTDASKWSSTKASFSGDPRSTARIMQVLAEFLQAGLVGDEQSASGPHPLLAHFPLWEVETLLVPGKSSAYAYLNLFGLQAEDETQMLDDQQDRLRDFAQNFEGHILVGIDAARKEGGELGRAAGLLLKILERARRS
ncbi:uncharacterized protein PV07_06874 [Cladophialophora immunda]|uniref:Pre-rRNA-processing protein n=1 Tax=Cladophialophora immunda TaxID=569365 RepID=A0A0D2CU17_9EURO|nr:uncharacterized protein PV07_06874 [Cladophialophora immunda]KIW27099.1 hypothetical protein PV07_06874 [Cladophialophora immunda]OQU99657.1 hypothetical protein CLAIMM_05261 [Cladophialophora immunda]